MDFNAHDGSITDSSAANNDIAEVYDGWEGLGVYFSNGHLIAAAPEMYATLEEAREMLLRTYDVTEWPANGKTEFDKCAADIESLLSRARGEV